MASLTISGMEAGSPDELAFQLASAAGQAFSQANVATDRDLILAEYYNAGYQNASFDWRAEPGEYERSVKLEYIIEEGEPLLVMRRGGTGPPGAM